MKKCPYCAEEIQDEAIFCKYCKRDLPTAQPAVNNAAVYSNTSQVYRVAKPKSNKKLVILVIILAVLILLIGLLIVVPTIIGYSMKYTVIPEGTYYDDNKYKYGVEALLYVSDPEWLDASYNGKDFVTLLLYSDGTGVFSFSKNSKIVEKGSFQSTPDGIECKYDSGKSVMLDSFIDKDSDMLTLDFMVLDNNDLKLFTCYLESAYDADGNIMEGYNYSELHG